MVKITNSKKFKSLYFFNFNHKFIKNKKFRANSLFGELIVKLYNEKPNLLNKSKNKE